MKTAAGLFFVPLASLALGSGGISSESHGEAFPGAEPIVATVDGMPIFAAEYQLIMQREMPAVLARFRRERNWDDHPGYWEDTGKIDTPIAALREATLGALTRIKTELALAKKHGIPAEISFATLREDLNRENARRASAVASRTVIYGPQLYSLSVYYDIRFNEAAHQLRQVMAKGAEPEISEASLREAYEARKPTLGEAAYDEARSHLRNTLALELAETRINAALRSARVEAHAKILSTIQPRSEP